MIKVNLKNIRHNVRELKMLAPKSQLMAVVKNNAYGHGLIEVSSSAIKGGATWLGVVHVWEGVALRQAGVKVPILVLGWVDVDEIESAIANNIDVPVMTFGQAKKIVSRIKTLNNKKLRIHIKIETGLHRFGIEGKELSELYSFIQKSDKLELVGAYSHLASVEEANLDYALKQKRRFEEQFSVIASAAKQSLIRHLGATSATILLPETHFDMVRCGIGIYGLWPSTETRLEAKNCNIKLELKPALSWVEPIVALKKVPAGEAVGYGCAWVPHRDSIVGLLPVGYADGLPRSLSGKGKVIIKDKVCDIVGRICTNVTFIDVTRIENVDTENMVTVISDKISSIVSCDSQAQRAGTINYELLTRLNSNLERKFI